jgi:hypothetical protein
MAKIKKIRVKLQMLGCCSDSGEGTPPRRLDLDIRRL